MRRCLECGRDAEEIADTGMSADYCSDDCARECWPTLVCLGAISVEDIDRALSTTGWSAP